MSDDDRHVRSAGEEDTYLGEVASDTVGQDHDDHIILPKVVVFGGLFESCNSTSAASTDEETLLGY